MSLMLNAALAVLMLSVAINASKSYPGFTVFDNGKGEYLRFTGPILARVNVSVSPHPPLHGRDTFKYYIQFMPTERIDSLFLKGQLKVHGWPVWSDDGTDDLCDGMTGKMACPLKPGVWYTLEDSLKLSYLAGLVGFYKGESTLYTITSQQEKKKFVGMEFAIKLQR